MKSDIDIKDDVYKVVNKSPLHKAVNGVLRKTLRPKDSDKEDIVISILANETKQAQIAYVNVNVYVPDEDVKGQYEEATVRLRQLCQLSFDLFLNVCDKDFRLTIADKNYQCGQRVLDVPEAHCHVINNKLLYQIINE